MMKNLLTALMNEVVAATLEDATQKKRTPEPEQDQSGLGAVLALGGVGLAAYAFNSLMRQKMQEDALAASQNAAQAIIHQNKMKDVVFFRTPDLIKDEIEEALATGSAADIMNIGERVMQRSAERIEDVRRITMRQNDLGAEQEQALNELHAGLVELADSKRSRSFIRKCAKMVQFWDWFGEATNPKDKVIIGFAGVKGALASKKMQANDALEEYGNVMPILEKAADTMERYQTQMDIAIDGLETKIASEKESISNKDELDSVRVRLNLSRMEEQLRAMKIINSILLDARKANLMMIKTAEAGRESQRMTVETIVRISHNILPALNAAIAIETQRERSNQASYDSHLALNAQRGVYDTLIDDVAGGIISGNAAQVISEGNFRGNAQGNTASSLDLLEAMRGEFKRAGAIEVSSTLAIEHKPAVAMPSLGRAKRREKVKMGKAL